MLVMLTACGKDELPSLPSPEAVPDTSTILRLYATAQGGDFVVYWEDLNAHTKDTIYMGSDTFVQWTWLPPIEWGQLVAETSPQRDDSIWLNLGDCIRGQSVRIIATKFAN